MKFGYKEFQVAGDPSGRKKCARPIIPVRIEYGDKSVGYEALLDSGSDWNLFPSILGEIIGIDIDQGTRATFGGIGGGQFVAYFHQITLYVGGWPIKIPAGFSADIPEKSSGVLGHLGFFDHFMVKFETKKQEVEVREYTNGTKSK